MHHTCAHTPRRVPPYSRSLLILSLSWSTGREIACVSKAGQWRTHCVCRRREKWIRARIAENSENSSVGVGDRRKNESALSCSLAPVNISRPCPSCKVGRCLHAPVLRVSEQRVGSRPVRAPYTHTHTHTYTRVPIHSAGRYTTV